MEKQHFIGKIVPYRQDFITNPKEEESKIMSDHFIYLKDLLEKKKLVFAGPTLMLEDPYGVLIFETDSQEEAKNLLKKDPSVKAGIQIIDDLRPIRLSFWRDIK